MVKSPYQVLLYISVVCTFGFLFLSLERQKNESGKRKRIEISEIMSGVEKRWKRLSSNTGNENIK